MSIGTGPGMGASTAARFAREGFDLILVARDVSKLAPLADSIREETGRDLKIEGLDATNYPAVQQLADRLGQTVGVVHYNAAAIHKTDILQTPMETIEHDLKVDIAAALAAIKYFSTHMEKRRKGTILLTGGNFAVVPSADYVSLSIGKAGIRCMTQALFPQLGAKGIHIATLTVMREVIPGSETATAAADAFWALHSQIKGQWTWEATLK